MKKLIAYLSAFKRRMLGGFCLKVVGTVAELLLPIIMAHMLDDVAPARNVLALSLWGAGMLAVAAAAWAGNVIANRMASRVARDTTERIRSDLFAKTLSLSARQTDAETVPSLVSRLSTDTYNVHTMVGMMQRIGVRAPILLVGGVALTFTVDPMLALIHPARYRSIPRARLRICRQERHKTLYPPARVRRRHGAQGARRLYGHPCY